MHEAWPSRSIQASAALLAVLLKKAFHNAQKRPSDRRNQRCTARVASHIAHQQAPKDQIHEEQRGILVIDIYAKERDGRRHQHEQDEECSVFQQGRNRFHGQYPRIAGTFFNAYFKNYSTAAKTTYSSAIQRETTPTDKPLSCRGSILEPHQNQISWKQSILAHGKQRQT